MPVALWGWYSGKKCRRCQLLCKNTSRIHALLGFKQDYDCSQLTHHIVARPFLCGAVTLQQQGCVLLCDQVCLARRLGNGRAVSYCVGQQV